MSNYVQYDTAQHDVHAVTVYSTRAEVKRSIEVELKQGRNEVELINLPTCLEEDSIRVEGFGNAVIHDMVYHPPSFDSSKREEKEETLRKLALERKAIEDEKRVVQAQVKVLEDYSKTLTGADTKAQDLETFLDVYAVRLNAQHKSLAEIDVRLADADKALEAERKRLRTDSESQKRAVKITVVVHADTDGNAELILLYVVPNASWTPFYDLRAVFKPQEGKESSSATVHLHYRASISQQTGEDWKDVELMLSTASPQLGSAIPKLSTFHISQQVQMPAYAKRRKSFGRPGGIAPQAMLVSAAPLRASALLGSSNHEELCADESDEIGIGSSSPPAFLRREVAQAHEGAVTASFGIPGLSSIPSDTVDASQAHKVSIVEFELSSVDLEWITVPKEIASTFLLCKVKNTSEYVLLPGETSVFMENSFVAKTRIEHVSPQESFSVSLGIDAAVRVTYHPQSKKKSASGSALIGSRTSNTRFVQRITVKNTRRAALSCLRVRDQIPVSTDSRIKVNIVEPSITGSAKESKPVDVAPNVRAHYLLKDNDSDSTVTDVEGMVEWICQPASGDTVDVSLVWDVSAPVGLKWAPQ